MKTNPTLRGFLGLGLALATAIASLLASHAAQATALTWNLTTNGDWNTSAANWTEAPNTFTDGSVDDVTFNKTNGGTINIAADMSPLSTTVSAASGTYIFSGGPIDSGTLAKSGAGILTLSSANSFSGVTMNAGTLNINDAGALGSGTFTISGGTIDNTSGSPKTLSTVIPLALNGNFTFNRSSGLNLGTGAVTLGTTVTISGPSATTVPLTIGGNIASTTNGLSLSKGAMVILNGTNNYTGTTSLLNFSGNLNILRADDGVGLPKDSYLYIRVGVLETGKDLIRLGGTSGGKMKLDGNNNNGFNGFSAFGGPIKVCFGTLETPEALTWGSGNFLPNNFGLILNHTTANNTLDFKNPVNLNAAVRTVQVGANVATMSGNLTGSGTSGLTKTGVGTLVLSGANTYSGNTTVSGGVLSITSAYLADASTVTIASGAKLDLNTGGASDTIATLVLNGETVPSGTYNSSHLTYGSYFTGSGSLIIGAAASSYTTWATANAGSQQPGLDWDNDGVSNGVEFFMNVTTPGFTANPALNGSNTITWTNGGNIPSSAYGTQFVVQTSNDLMSWADVPATGDANLNNVSGSVSYTLTGAAPRFVRLKVTPN